jgi:hypothetical protein
MAEGSAGTYFGPRFPQSARPYKTRKRRCLLGMKDSDKKGALLVLGILILLLVVWFFGTYLPGMRNQARRTQSQNPLFQVTAKRTGPPLSNISSTAVSPKH